MKQFNGIKHRYVLVNPSNELIKGDSQRYDVVSKAIKLEQAGQAPGKDFHLLVLDPATGEYKGDEIGYDQIYNRADVKNRREKGSTTKRNTQLKESLNDLSAVFKSAAAMERTGTLTEEGLSDLVDAFFETAKLAGIERKVIASALAKHFPRENQQQ